MRTADARRAGQGTNHGKNGKSRKKKRDKPFSVVPIFFGMAVAFVIGAFILVYLIFANSTNPLFSNRADVQLIDFVNMTESEFRASDYYTQLSPKWQYEYNSQYEEGVIYQQNPRAGRIVKEGQAVTLYVSMGPLWVTIPDTIIGMDKDEAEQAIKDMGVNNVVSSFVIDDSVTSGTVVRTDPAAGQQVEGDATVTLYIAQASIDTTVELVSVEGLQVEEARARLTRLNVTPSVEEIPSDQPAGTVLSMSPAGGSTVRIGSTVRLTVSSGVPETPVTTNDGVLNGDPNTIVKRWSEDLGDGNWEDRYQTGDGSVYRSGRHLPVQRRMTGYITKGVGGFYYVRTDAGVQECRARGIFRKRGVTPVAGDNVTLNAEGNMIDDIAPRKNVFVRPPVANLDVLFIVASTTQPVPSTLVLDKLAAAALYQNVQPVLVFTKTDLSAADMLAADYAQSGLPLVFVHYDTGEGLDELRGWIRGRLCAFCGNSGVGKSTLLNTIAPQLHRETGEISPQAGPRPPYHPRDRDL